MLSARWLLVSTAGWVWYSACAADWPERSTITFASDTLGAVAVGTLSMEVTVVLVKLIMDDKRREAREEADQAREVAEQAQNRVRVLEEALKRNNIEIPADPATTAEPAESSR